MYKIDINNLALTTEEEITFAKLSFQMLDAGKLDLPSSHLMDKYFRKTTDDFLGEIYFKIPSVLAHQVVGRALLENADMYFDSILHDKQSILGIKKADRKEVVKGYTTVQETIGKVLEVMIDKADDEKFNSVIDRTVKKINQLYPRLKLNNEFIRKFNATLNTPKYINFDYTKPTEEDYAELTSIQNTCKYAIENNHYDYEMEKTLDRNHQA